MQTKHRKIMLIISVALIMVLFTSVLAINSYSRYVVEENAKYTDTENNTTMDYIDYTVNSVFVVRTQDELFSAINQGYSYVQLDKNIENPLIVTQNAETLDRDLILDLNGIEIQRNGYDPILRVNPGVRLTVVDTSEEQTGGLYNPVGSVFQIIGGTLTVVAGTFESGPRYSEYYSYNTSVLNNNGDTKRTIIDEYKDVIYYTKSGEDFSEGKSIVAPIIRSYPTKTGEIKYNHGNLYFDETVKTGGFIIKPDTYCYYRTSEDSAANSTEVATADWYYTYYVEKDTYKYVGTAARKSYDDVQITIYGYENVINQASNKNNSSEYHAAIQMTSGTLDVQSGSFNQYFGVNKTACVNAQGGEIKIKKGSFSSRIPNALSFNSSSVLIKESDKLSYNESYFDNFKWNTAESNASLARSGQAYCILNGDEKNGGNANVTIGTGDLYSSNNNIISMQSGDLTINGGNFTKRETIVPTTVVDSSSAVNVVNGNLSLSGANCNVIGKNSIGVQVKAGTLSIDNSHFNVNGESSYGIRSLIASNTNFTVKNSNFTITGDYSYGIYSENGQVNISSDATNTIKIDGDGSKGIYVLNGGSVHSTGYIYTLSGDNSQGIHGESTASSLIINGGSMTVKKSNTYGIYSEISGDDKFTVTDFSITMQDGSGQTAIYSANGKVTLSTTNGASIKVDGVSSRGIYVLGSVTETETKKGSVQSTGYDYTITGDKSAGIEGTNLASSISMNNGTMTVTGNGETEQSYTYGIKSAVSGTDSFNVNNFHITMAGSGTQQIGIYSTNGTVNLNYTTDTTSSDKGLIYVNGDNSAGIYTGTGGSVVSDNYSYTIEGANSSGIYASAGSVTLSNGDITLSSNNSTYGIYASSTEQLNITLNNSIINVGYVVDGVIDTTNKSKSTVSASAGVFLSSSNTNSFINLTDTSIYSYELGIVSNGGKVEIHNTGTNESIIKTNKASAIAIRGGDVVLAEGSNCTIESYNTTSSKTANEYTMTLPVRKSDNTLEDTTYVNTDGIYVNGGSFTSNGTLKLTHTGLQNVYSKDDIAKKDYNYNTLVVKSYALRVYGGNVTITGKTDITATVGGGVYAGISPEATTAGNITLGTSSTTAESITVNTTGEDYGDEYNALGGTASMGSWQNRRSITGGHAVEMNGGSITIYNGTYDAAFGNGVYASGNGTITIHNGTFNGWMGKKNKITGKTGPSAYYGLKVVGGATVHVYDGKFNGGNGGAFVTGVTKVDGQTISEHSTAEVYIYAGEFGKLDNNKATAPDGFNVYDDVVIVFGAKTSDASVDDIKVYGYDSSIAANPITQNSGQTETSTISVYYGTYGTAGMYKDTLIGTTFVTYNTKTGLTNAVNAQGVDGNTTVKYYNPNEGS